MRIRPYLYTASPSQGRVSLISLSLSLTHPYQHVNTVTMSQNDQAAPYAIDAQESTNMLLNHPIPRLRRVRARFGSGLVARDPSDLVLDHRLVAQTQIVRLGRTARPRIGIPDA